MKKIFTAIVLFALVVLPMSVMAMTTINDNELSTVTGQAGVSINVDFTTNLSIGTVAWGDSDGLDGAGTGSAAGYVGISALNLTIHVSGRHDGPFENVGATVGYFRNDPITIDVGTTLGVSAVRIGLPTAHITVSALDFNIFLSGADSVTGDPATPQVLGAIYIGGLDIKLGQTALTGAIPYDDASGASYDAGYVTIAAASTAANAGVHIGFNVKIDSLSIGQISYGNTTSILQGTGIGTLGATSGGFVGLKSFVLDDVNINGGVAIGVGTINGTPLGVSSFGTHTMVNIVIDNGTQIAIPGSIKGTIYLAQDKLLSVNDEELGNFFIGHLTATFVDQTGSMSAHSLVQIWAH